eukprot:1195799-Prorocentrum_minimum.AAC.3
MPLEWERAVLVRETEERLRNEMFKFANNLKLTYFKRNWPKHILATILDRWVTVCLIEPFYEEPLK